MSGESQTKNTFFVLGDWGTVTAANTIAQAMNTWAIQHQIQPTFIIALGDNFYPRGVNSVKDDLFKKVWEDNFLVYPSLRVPWRMVLGNHDYKVNPQAQVEYTYAPENTTKLWYMPDKNYAITEQFPDGLKIDIFAMDTNGAQNSVIKRYPGIREEVKKNKQWLLEALSKSKNPWKIVFAHHPLYTKGNRHGIIGRYLRDDTYVAKEGDEPKPGFGIEKILIDAGVNIWLAGHEHVLQHKHVKGIDHFVISSGGSGFGWNGGKNPNVDMDWWNKSPGFLVVTVSQETMLAQFVDSQAHLLHTVQVHIDHKSSVVHV